MKKLLIYMLIAGLVGCVFSITMQNVGTNGLNSSGTTVISTLGISVAYADTLGGPNPPPPPPIPK